MSNCAIAVAESIGRADDSLRASYVDFTASSLNDVENLMDVNECWVIAKEEDVMNAVKWGGSLTPAGASYAAAYNLQYQSDSTAGDAQSAVWQALVQSNQQTVNGVSDARTGNFNQASGMAGLLSTIGDILTKS